MMYALASDPITHTGFTAMTPSSLETPRRREPLAQDRRMIRAELMGSHSHDTAGPVRVHVWQRGGNFLRGDRIEGSASARRWAGT